MQLPTYKKGEVKRLIFYAKDVFKFYDVGVPYLVQVLFLLMLGILFVAYLFALPYAEELNKISNIVMTKVTETSTVASGNINIRELVTPEMTGRIVTAFTGYLALMVGAKAIVTFLSLFYACVWHLKRVTPGMPFSYITRGFLKRILPLVAVNLIFYGAIVLLGVVLSILLSLLGLIVPSFAILLASAVPVLYFVANALFVYRDLSVLVGGTRPTKTLRIVWNLVGKNRRQVIGNMITMYILGLFVSVLSAGFSGQALLAIFASVFAEVVLLLVQQRLVVRMYEDTKGMTVPETIKKEDNAL